MEFIFYTRHFILNVSIRNESAIENELTVDKLSTNSLCLKKKQCNWERMLPRILVLSLACQTMGL